MPDIKCSNPACQRVNADTRAFCSNCGWRLLKAVDIADSIKDPTAILTAYTDLQRQYDQLLADHQKLLAVHEDLSTSQQLLQQKQDELASSHQGLADQHQAAVVALSTTRQKLDESETWKQRAADEIKELKTRIESFVSGPQSTDTKLEAAEAEIARLSKLSTETQKAYTVAAAKVEDFESSGVGKATWPLRKKIILGVLAAVVGSAGGATAGMYSPLNPARKLLNSTIKGENQQEQSLAATTSQLKQTKDDLDKAKADFTTQQQSNVQLSEQINTLNQGSQAAARQLSTVQNQLNTSKGETAKEHAEVTTTQQELQNEKAQVRELSQKAALASSLQSIIAAHPYLNYKGQTQGTITIKYSGKNDKPSTISLDHFNSSSDSGVKVDSVSGAQLPGVPIVLEPLSKNLSVISPPSQSNNWQKMTLNVQGKGSNSAVLRWTIF